MNAFRSGFIAVIGLPNAGKSSLVNKMVHENVSIVTAKPQTTRKRTLGVLTEPGRFQMVFVDTPGIIESESGLNPYLKSELQSAIEKDIDVLIATIAPWEFDTDKKPWALTIAEKVRKPVIYVATQTDRKETNFNNMIQKWQGWWTDPERTPRLVITSSRKGTGINELRDDIYGYLSEGPQYYDPEIYTPQSMREMTSEVIRKECFEYLHEEIPYGLAVVIRSFKEGQICKIEADIIVSKESHKPMVIGKGAKNVKQIGVRARYELERMLGQKVFLKLQVIVKPHWLRDRSWLEELGYV